MTKIAFILLTFITLASCSEAQQAGNTEVQHNEDAASVKKVIPAAEFKAMLGEDIQLIDVRTPTEVSAGKIENALNIDFNSPDFKAEIEKLDKDKKTLVYCAAGGRSGKAAQLMHDIGFKEVYDLQGGYGNWPYK